MHGFPLQHATLHKTFRYRLILHGSAVQKKHRKVQIYQYTNFIARWFTCPTVGGVVAENKIGDAFSLLLIYNGKDKEELKKMMSETGALEAKKELKRMRCV